MAEFRVEDRKESRSSAADYAACAGLRLQTRPCYPPPSTPGGESALLCPDYMQYIRDDTRGISQYPIAGDDRIHPVAWMCVAKLLG